MVQPCRRELRGSDGAASGEREPGETLSGSKDSYGDPLQENLHNRGP